MVQELQKKLESGDLLVCVVGVGYVGEPLARAFSHHIDVIGYDIDKNKVSELKKQNDNSRLNFTYDENEIRNATAHSC